MTTIDTSSAPALAWLLGVNPCGNGNSIESPQTVTKRADVAGCNRVQQAILSDPGFRSRHNRRSRSIESYISLDDSEVDCDVEFDLELPDRDVGMFGTYADLTGVWIGRDKTHAGFDVLDMLSESTKERLQDECLEQV